MKFYFSLIILSFLGASTQAQTTIYGYVENAATKERLIGANVIDTNSNIGTASNEFGYFSIKNSEKAMAIVASYVGSLSTVLTINTLQDTFIVIAINMDNTIEEVTVSTNDYLQRVGSPLGMVSISVANVQKMPTLGETDVLKALQYQPGVKGGVEGSAGVYVRGGDHGENLFLLDDVPVYNVSHMYGFFSAFNSSAIKDLKLMKGSFPANYGGRASSVVSIRSREGTSEKLSGEVGLGLVSSKLMFEGPLFSKKTTFIMSGRSSYINLVMNPLKQAGLADESFPNFNFYDLNLALTHTFSRRDRLYLNAYYGKDKISSNTDESIKIDDYESYETSNDLSGWGNTIGSMRWNHAYGGKLFSNLTLAASNYSYGAETSAYLNNKFEFNGEPIELVKDYAANYTSYVFDIITKMDFDYDVNNKIALKFGAGNTHHTIQVNDKRLAYFDSGSDLKLDTTFIIDPLKTNEFFAYVASEMKISTQFTLNAGLRLSGQAFNGDSQMDIEPRVSANYAITHDLTIKLGYSRMIQYLSLINMSNTGMQLDIWVPNVNDLKPLYSNELSGGISYKLAKQWFASLELYYKKLENTTALNKGMSLFSSEQNVYDMLVQGNGTAKGVEFALQKQLGKITGNVNYTLSNAERIYKDINNGASFPFKYDRLHDLSIGFNYQFASKWDFSALWYFGTGFPVSLPTTKYRNAIGIIGNNLDFDLGEYIQYYPSINNYRLPAYHRLDVGFHYQTSNKIGKHKFSFDVFNAYNRKNPISAKYMSSSGQLRYTYLLPFIPSVSYTLKF